MFVHESIAGLLCVVAVGAVAEVFCVVFSVVGLPGLGERKKSKLYAFLLVFNSSILS